VVPIQVGATYQRMFPVTLIPLTDTWAKRNFAICFSETVKHQPAVMRLLEFLQAKRS